MTGRVSGILIILSIKSKRSWSRARTSLIRDSLWFALSRNRINQWFANEWIKIHLPLIFDSIWFWFAGLMNKINLNRQSKWIKIKNKMIRQRESNFRESKWIDSVRALIWVILQPKYNHFYVRFWVLLSGPVFSWQHFLLREKNDLIIRVKISGWTDYR